MEYKYKMQQRVENDKPVIEQKVEIQEPINPITDEDKKIIQETITTESPEKEKYLYKSSGAELGYYLTKDETQLSNFIIHLTKWVKTHRDGEPLSYYEGDVYLNDGTSIHINRMAASALEDLSKFRRFIGNLCGIKGMIYSSSNDIVKAVKTFNKDVPMFEETEFGYNHTLDCYYTEGLLIKADNIQETKTLIKSNEMWGNSKLGFKFLSIEETNVVKQTIVDKLLLWDDPKVIYNLLAFAFYPLIYPLLRKKNPNKFYMMLKGPSGSGKSQMSKWMQNFYGEFPTLLAWTSTDTSINIIGNGFKDAMLTVDDLKVQNLRSDSDARKVMMLLQNYSDGTGRQRAGSSLKLQDERVIKGHLLINAEDLVLTESSTFSRGIIIDIYSKRVKLKELFEITEASKSFSAVMPHFIQFILMNFNEGRVAKIFEESHKFISSHPLIDDPNVSVDNLPRIINNFAALRSSWQIASEFIFKEKSELEKTEYQNTFDQNLISLLLDNIERINSYKPEVKFDRALWEKIEDGTFILRKVLKGGEVEGKPHRRSKVIGYYSNDITGNITLVIQLSTALKEIRRTIENFTISEDTLTKKLLHDKKIKVNPSKKFSLNGRKISGVQWIGEIPKSIFGIKETNPVEVAKEILKNKNEKKVLKII